MKDIKIGDLIKGQKVVCIKKEWYGTPIVVVGSSEFGRGIEYYLNEIEEKDIERVGR